MTANKATPAGETAGGEVEKSARTLFSDSNITDSDPRVNWLAAAYRYILSAEWGRDGYAG